MKKTTYAVVDIETTGTDPKKDRIIQFGCVLVENDEIVTRFATDINPNQMISKQIQSLTGISNGRVQKAPYFEDVALTIYNLLADTIFVAHNIYFDYKFLNHELQRCGVPALTIAGIDTVELAQIFLPTEMSFRLGDLAESLGLVHDNPHQADSDAEVTAELLLLIQKRMRALPLITLEKIAELSNLTGMETSQFILQNLEEMRQEPQPLADNLQVIAGIALRKKEVTLYQEDYYSEKKYPKAAAAKKKVFKENLEVRKEQNQLMNLVYKHYTTSPDKNLVIEAATGLGKTIGYLLPLSYLATPEKPAIISTASIVLQQQILNKDIPLLNQVLDKKIQATLVKSSRHYLDLQRFYHSLAAPVQQKQYALYQMAVLVWLTETTTGDFDELQMTNLSHVFWQEVCHQGSNYLSENQPFYQADFLLHLQRKMQQSNFLIVNHAYLAQESVRETVQLPASDYLLIDEAHHLHTQLEKISQEQFSVNAFQKKIQQVLAAEQIFEELQGVCQSNQNLSRELALLQRILEDLLEEQQDFFPQLIKLLPKEKNSNYQRVEGMFEKQQIESLSAFGFAKLQQILLLYSDLLTLQREIHQELLTTLGSWQAYEARLYGELFQLFAFTEKYQRIFEAWTQNWQPQIVHCYYYDPKKEDLVLFTIDFQGALLEKTTWYQRYPKVLFLGGTMKIGNNRHYFPQRWGIPETKVKVLANPYDFEKQVKLFVLDEGVDVGKVTPAQYNQEIIANLKEIIKQENRRLLVLFTAHDVLQKVFYALHSEMLDEGRELLAQGISGGREKLLKRFFLSDNAVLLGADSFWEGIDLPGDTLQLLVVTRLPFENPQRPFVKAYYHYLEEQGVNTFYQEAIPKAAMRLRQALGRLIRSKNDQGVMIVLDRRLITASYSRQLLKAFPESLAIQEAPLTEILEETQKFLTKNPQED
ncbi:ATP-dependent DNA helicase DinG [Enterococcus sp. PF1-24]|uniref:helicase C-terminal domain-containing protein n=1 Tax=unclassified Enterococcus TaxID=2608891 RepID=UPI002474E7F6|nr:MULTISPECIES: helicase C-terminal domain-containing protein [unclassified Enterococcus]MDH6364975.1 ATP-dependent DNA helicase DinG [Enterococcus sp. PFB1-1]MDH6402076.1 ATP-dependent DNA helicase DinG [Enterococcus sp. PF1-24]